MKGSTWIIIDTNFWVIPFTIGIDILQEIDSIVHEKHEIMVLKDSFEELKKIESRQAGTALSWIETLLKRKALKIVEFPSKVPVDDQLIELGKKQDVIIATQDKELSDKLRAQGTRVIKVRGKNRLEIIN